MSGIHQFVPMLHVGDAVGGHTMALQALLRGEGLESQIYVEKEDDDTKEVTRPAATYRADAKPGDVLVYQFAVASDLARWLALQPERLIVNYHNVTPPELFAPWDDGLARHQVRALFQLSAVASRAELGVAVSEVNRVDLVKENFAATAVVPPIVDLHGMAGSATAREDARARGARWLAVGRLAPNKALEDVIAALLAYRVRYDPEARLQVIGKSVLPSYTAALHRYAAELGLADAVQFSGKVSGESLAHAYAASDVLVVSSEHEGFCIPVVEAMSSGLPVVAYRQGALPEVLGTAGVLLEAKDPLAMADAIHRVQVEPRWRERLLAAGRARVVSLDLARAGPRLVDLLVVAHEDREWPEGVVTRRPEESAGGPSFGASAPVTR